MVVWKENGTPSSQRKAVCSCAYYEETIYAFSLSAWAVVYYLPSQRLGACFILFILNCAGQCVVREWDCCSNAECSPEWWRALKQLGKGCSFPVHRHRLCDRHLPQLSCALQAEYPPNWTPFWFSLFTWLYFYWILLTSFTLRNFKNPCLKILIFKMWLIRQYPPQLFCFLSR